MATDRVCSTPKSLAAVYRKAAKLVEDMECSYACEAIGEVMDCIGFAHEQDHPALRLLKPQRLSTCGGYWHSDNGRDARVLGLCLMAAIVEAGDV
jgi:hypothetical protein